MGSLADKYRAKEGGSLAAKYRVAPADDGQIDPLDGEVAKPEGGALDFLKPDRPVGAFGAGVQQGVTLGFADEMTGAAGVVEEGSSRMRQAVGLEEPSVRDVDPAVNPNSPAISKSFGPAQPAGAKPIIPEAAPVRPSLADTYRRIRDGDRDTNKVSEKEHGGLYATGELAGGLAVPIPGSGLAKGAGLGARVLRGAKVAGGLGAAIGAGKSEADSAGGVAGDAVINGAVAAPLGAIGGAAGHVFDKLATRFGGNAEAAKTAEELRRLDEVRGSALGSMRQAKGEAIRLLERATADSNNPRLSQGARDKALAFLDGQEGKALAEEAAASLMEQAPEQMGRMASTKTEFLGAPAEAAKQSADYFAKNTLTADVLPRALHYGKPALAAAIGGVAGGPAGAAAGGLLGVASGAPGRAIANLAKRTPRFTVQLNQLLERGSGALRDASQSPAGSAAVGNLLKKYFSGEELTEEEQAQLAKQRP